MYTLEEHFDNFEIALMVFFAGYCFYSAGQYAFFGIETYWINKLDLKDGAAFDVLFGLLASCRAQVLWKRVKNREND